MPELIRFLDDNRKGRWANVRIDNGDSWWIRGKHGVEGIEKAFKDKPQLILMDILMPKMDGIEGTRQIHSNPKTKDIPILAASALLMASDLSSCIEAGCSDYITKPFTPKELREKIQNIFPAEWQET
ncbi:MAG: response regulator [Nitrososphaerales archaeon]